MLGLIVLMAEFLALTDKGPDEPVYLPQEVPLAWQYVPEGPGLIQTTFVDTVELVFLREFTSMENTGPSHERLSWEPPLVQVVVIGIHSGRPREYWYENSKGLYHSHARGRVGSLLVPRDPNVGEQWWWTSDSLRRIAAVRDTVINGTLEQLVVVTEQTHNSVTDTYHWVTGVGLVYYKSEHGIDYLLGAESASLRRVGTIVR